MCNSPMYRLRVVEYEGRKIAPRFRKRIKNGGILMDEQERDYLISFHGFTQEQFDTIPCGCCFGCKSDYQALWTTRAMCESMYHDSNLFVTLTYNDENINCEPIIHALTGEIKNIGVLVKDDFSAFIKRLRNYVPQFRFLSCGEYGDTTKRPHFHFLGFGLELNDLVYFYSKQRNGKITYGRSFGTTDYYLSETLSKAWGKGYVLVTPLTFENCSYVASYVNKKQTPKQIKLAQGSEEVLEQFAKQFDNYSKTVDNCIALGKIPSPFLHMSRRPGLASEFIEDNFYYYFKYNKLPLINGKRLPKQTNRYFDNIYKKRDLEFMLDDMKKRRLSLIKDNYLPFADNGKEQRKIREEKLKLRHEKRKPRDL